MYQFCFNECIPVVKNKYTLCEKFSNNLYELSKICKIFSKTVNGIITHKLPSSIILDGDEFTIQECIKLLENKDLRTFAYSQFNKYPVENFFQIESEDKLLENDFHLFVNSIKYSAINLAIVAENSGIMFTLMLHLDLHHDKLKILAINAEFNREVLNLFGDNDNTKYLTDIIERSISFSSNEFEKLIILLKTDLYSSRFKKEYCKLNQDIQRAIYSHFEKAIKREGTSRFFADGDLIKDVTPKDFEYKVLELRIFEPVAHRVYFSELNNNIYLANVGKKTSEKKQDNDINTAASIIFELVSINS